MITRTLPPCLIGVQTTGLFCHLSVAQWSANSISMKACHAAALALVGWYLMVPPRPFAEAPPPPSQWSVYHVYDSADKCNYVRANIASGVLEDAPPDFVERFGNTFMRTFERARCIAIDDPRLKEK